MPPLKFATDEKSLRHNDEILGRFDFDLSELLDHLADTTLGYGSEFRPISQLQKIFGQHANFPFFRSVLQKGMSYMFSSDISEEVRRTELVGQMERGNHKSATSNPGITKKALETDVRHGFALPLPAATVHKIPGAMVQPCGLASQFSLQADGSRKLKHRLTHDLSYQLETQGKVSVNSRVDMQQYPEMIFGWCLPRIVHFIVALRLAFPTKRILIAKYDFSDAYRRIAHSSSAAVQSIIVWAGIAFLALRLSFGGSPNPPTWCSFSEMVTDLSNEIPLDAAAAEGLRSPGQPETPTPVLVDADVPIARGRSLAVKIPTSVTARTDSFIDDLIRIFLDTIENRRLQPHAVPIAVHVANRPNAGPDEPIPRRENLSGAKLEAEGTPAEVQIVLGWEIDTRRLMIRLTFDKFVAWSADLTDVTLAGRATIGELQTLVGRLNHAAYVIPLSRHFLGRLRQRLHINQSARQHLSFSKDELADLQLWTKFLHSAREGISLNNLTLRQPSQIGLSDSCPFGMGGFTWTGRAWRLRIPEACLLHGVSEANNILEFLAMAVTIWLVLSECRRLGLQEESILSLGDNTSAIGWIFRSSRLDPSSPYYKPVQLVARKIAELLMNSSQSLCAQHIKGASNFVPDWLSFTTQNRDGKANPVAFDDPSDHTLTQRLHVYSPQLIPKNFVISPLPNEILSFVELVLRTTESSMSQSNRRRTRTKTGPGVGGWDSVPRPGSWTPSSLEFPTQPKSSSSDPFLSRTKLPIGIDQGAYLEQIRRPWLERLSGLPQAIWLRRFGTVSNQAPFTSRTAPGSSPP
jgi:hypothetical protein